MRLGFQRPKYVKTGNRLDLDHHSRRPVYNYIEWLADISRKYGVGISYGEGPKGHYVEMGPGGKGALNSDRIYTLHSAKMIRERILWYVSFQIRQRNYERKATHWEVAKANFERSLTPGQRSFWDAWNKKLEDERGW